MEIVGTASAIDISTGTGHINRCDLMVFDISFPRNFFIIAQQDIHFEWP